MKVQVFRFVLVLGSYVAVGLDVKGGLNLGLIPLDIFGRGHHPDPSLVGECPCFPGPCEGGKCALQLVDGVHSPEFFDLHVEVEEASVPAVHLVDLVVEIASENLAEGVQDHIWEVLADVLGKGGGTFWVTTHLWLLGLTMF